MSQLNAGIDRRLSVAPMMDWTDERYIGLCINSLASEEKPCLLYVSSRSGSQCPDPLGDIRLPTGRLNQGRVFLQALPLEAPRNRELGQVREHARSSWREIKQIEQRLLGCGDLCIGLR